MSDQQTQQNEFVPTNYEQPRKTDIWKMLWRGKWLILLGLIVGSGLGYLYYLRQDPVFQSSARVVITSTRTTVPGINSSVGDYQSMYDRMTTLATQSALIRSPFVVRRALEEEFDTADESLADLQAKIDEELYGTTSDPELAPKRKRRNLQELPTLRGSSNPTSTILAGLSVQPAKGNAQILDLSFRGGNPEDCQAILDAVIASYKGYLRGSRDARTKQTIALIMKTKNELGRDIEEKEKAHNKFRRENAHVLFRGEEGQNVHQERLWEIESARSELLLNKTRILADLKSIEKQSGDGVEHRVILASRMQDTSGDREFRPAADSTEDALIPLWLDEASLLEDFGKDHPDVVAVRNRIKLTRELTGMDEIEPESSERPWNPLDFYVASMQQRLATIEAEDEQLRQLFLSEQEAAKGMEEIEQTDHAFLNEIARKQELHRAVITKLEEIELTDDVGGYEATEITPAGYGSKVEPSFPRTMGISVVLGLACGVGLAYLVDFADKRFRSPDEVQNELGIPLIGHVPVLRGETSDDELQLDPMLCTFHTPRAPSAEAYRAVRTALYFSVRAAGHQVIQVTSPSPGDGKTTLSANLAVAIANSNKRVLLLDADCRRPRVHKVFNMDRKVGLSSIIEGELEAGEVIKDTPIENLTVMTAGPRTQNPAELLTSPKFEELLALLRDQFDFVVVDTPPLMAVTDASVVAPRVDGVVLTLRITKRARANSRRAAEMLDAVGANVLGVVVNGIAHRQGAYGYGSRGYGYGYGYGYSSAYTYGSEESARYFAEDREGDDEMVAAEAQSPGNGRGRRNRRRR